LVSCIPVETTNPEKAYTYWAGTEPPTEIEIINAQYYQSPHFTLEYEFYLKFKPTLKWITEFIEQNGLELDKQNSDWSMWADLPEWFVPEADCLIYKKRDKNHRSRYFVNPKNGVCYIYDTVGM
jgi:hypothetical protein